MVAVPIYLSRYIGLHVSSFTLIGGLWMLWDKHKQMWHDKLAGTFVITKERKNAGEKVDAK